MRARRLTLITSEPLIEEVLRTLSRERVRRRYQLTQSEIERVRLLLEQDAAMTALTAQVRGVATHPEEVA